MTGPLLIFGSTGQVGQELARRTKGAACPLRDVADLADPASIEATIYESAPSAIINAAAWTNVDKAEDHAAEAFAINGIAPGKMAEAAADLEIPLVHISTDYVFDGAGDEPWGPDDPAGPLGVYGQSKLQGEREVIEVGGTFAILRTSWVFSSHGKNFVKTMLRLSEAQSAVEVVNDQFGGPTSAASIAEACLTIAKGLIEDPARTGTYHFAGAPHVTWAEFAKEVFEQAGRSARVAEVPTELFPTPAERPLNSRLDCESTLKTFGISQPDWRKDLTQVLQELSQAAGVP
ncbi:MAG: dTDP-4-dehydrorhamnose reductase [Pseudomonadota bacterium]